MNAHKFVAEKGIEEAKQVLSGAPDFPVFGYCVLTGSYIFERKHANAYYHNETNSWSEDYALELIILKELKQVVESLDTIDRLFGLDQAKHTMKIAKEIGYTSDYEQIKQEIADYELVESYKSSNSQAISKAENQVNGTDLKKDLSVKQEAQSHKQDESVKQCEVLDMVDVSPRCEVIDDE